MFGLFKKQPIGPSPEVQKVQLAGRHIVQAAELAVHAFQDEPNLQWESAHRWVFYCATIPAFALVIKFEMFRELSLVPTSAQNTFFKTVEDRLFDVYRQISDDDAGTIRHCLPLTAERALVCKSLGVDADTCVRFDLLLGLILPNRLGIYQRDWGCGFSSPGVHGLPEYAAMRFAADMAGIATPPSLEGYTARDLSIEKYGSALIVLSEFGASYLKARNELRSA